MTRDQFKQRFEKYIQDDKHAGLDSRTALALSAAEMAWDAHVRLNAMRTRVISNMMRSALCAGVLLGWGIKWLATWLAT